MSRLKFNDFYHRDGKNGRNKKSGLSSLDIVRVRHLKERLWKLKIFLFSMRLKVIIKEVRKTLWSLPGFSRLYLLSVTFIYLPLTNLLRSKWSNFIIFYFSLTGQKVRFFQSMSFTLNYVSIIVFVFSKTLL